MIVNKIYIPGIYVLKSEKTCDSRGTFTKIFTENEFKTLGFPTFFSEEYVTRSKKGVIRGLHFQEPPMDMAKIVSCLNGKIWDVAVDLRSHLPTYGKFFSIELSEKLGNQLIIPPGIAHGFQALSDDALVLYKTTRPYEPLLDSGVLWSSLNIPWPLKESLVSDRDKSFLAFKDYISPFTQTFLK